MSYSCRICNFYKDKKTAYLGIDIATHSDNDPFLKKEVLYFSLGYDAGYEHGLAEAQENFNQLKNSIQTVVKEIK